jgi:hypothetical protein
MLLCAFEENNHHSDNCNLELYTPVLKFTQTEKTIINSSDAFEEFIGEVELDLHTSTYDNANVLSPTDKHTAIIPLRGPPIHIS